MKSFTIGGVPEHFNLPWYFTLRDKKYQEKGINLRWKDFYGGTGEMCAALRTKEIDMAVILTEGIIRDIIQGNECKIVQVFIDTPLVWGIHVAQQSSYNSIDSLKGKSAAISRFGSGSHLMAYVLAEQENWDLKNDLNFKVVQDLDGALSSLPKGEGDYFMWEKFTTQPYVENGVFRLVGECPTPWPCFVIAVRNEILRQEKTVVKEIITIINSYTRSFKNTPQLDKLIANRYQLKEKAVQDWLAITEWSQAPLSIQKVEDIQNTLYELELISDKIPSDKLLRIL